MNRAAFDVVVGVRQVRRRKPREKVFKRVAVFALVVVRAKFHLYYVPYWTVVVRLPYLYLAVARLPLVV